jgi:hypothetical protein
MQCGIFVDCSSDGFSGNIEMELYDFTLFQAESRSSTLVHCVMHGFGEFAGQTLKLFCDGLGMGSWTGFCLKGWKNDAVLVMEKSIV